MMVNSMAIPKAKEAFQTVDTSGWLTRAQAIDLLGVSMNSIRRWEAEGILHVQFAMRDSAREVAVIDPRELCRVPRRHRTPIPNEEGELCARVFEMLDDGMTVREIVINTRETSQRIEGIRDNWLDAGGADLVVSKEARAEYERITGKPLRRMSDLVETLASLVPTNGETLK
jgi:hypothetical protein